MPGQAHVPGLDRLEDVDRRSGDLPRAIALASEPHEMRLGAQAIALTQPSSRSTPDGQGRLLSRPGGGQPIRDRTLVGIRLEQLAAPAIVDRIRERDRDGQVVGGLAVGAEPGGLLGGERGKLDDRRAVAGLDGMLGQANRVGRCDARAERGERAPMQTAPLPGGMASSTDRARARGGSSHALVIFEISRARHSRRPAGAPLSLRDRRDQATLDPRAQDGCRSQYPSAPPATAGRRASRRRHEPSSGTACPPAAMTSVTKNGFPPVARCRSAAIDAGPRRERADGRRVSGGTRRSVIKPGGISPSANRTDVPRRAPVRGPSR